MPSLKSRIAAFVVRRTRKKVFSSAAGMNACIRAERLIEDHRPPHRLHRTLKIRRRWVAGMPVYEVRPAGRPRHWPGSMRLVYLHGGAYLFEITHHHWQMIADMAQRLNARVTVPIYPLAPEQTVGRTFRQMLRLYRRLLRETPPEQLVLMGDSAGGHMAVVMSMMAAEEGLPAPSRQVLISPGLDMSLSNPQLRELERIDPWLGIDGGLEALRLCAPDIDRTHWQISPIYGNLAALPPTMILTGTHDLLSADNVCFAQKAAAEGVDVELMVEEGMMHVWPLIDMPEAYVARDRIAAFLHRTRPQPAARQTAPAAAAPARTPMPAGGMVAA